MSAYRRFLTFLLLAAWIASAGCRSRSGQTSQAPTTAPALREQWTTAPIPVPPQQARPVTQGSVPLLYLVETAQVVRVVDLTANQDLLRLPVPANTLIAVDAKAGVRVGGATMRLGPLPSDHIYAICLEATESNVVRHGTIRPGHRRGSADQPARSP